MSIIQSIKRLLNHKENFIENKNDALNIICSHLSRYSRSTDRNLAVLELWIVSTLDDEHVEWADGTFIKELKSRLQQELITGIKSIELHHISPDDICGLITGENMILPIIKGRLYYRTHGISEQGSTSIHGFAPAWLVCIGGVENVNQKIFELEPNTRYVWNIGRSENLSVVEKNDIVILDDCKGISRLHAAIILDEGKYYLKCKPRGCRAKNNHNKVFTKINRANGIEEELVTLSHKALPYLKEGDIINLSNLVYFRITFNNPHINSVPFAHQGVD